MAKAPVWWKIAKRMMSNTFTVHRVMSRLFSWWNRCKQRFSATEASLRTLRSAISEKRMKSENSGMISFRELVAQQCDEKWMNGDNVHRWVALRLNGENRKCVMGWNVLASVIEVANRDRLQRYASHSMISRTRFICKGIYLMKLNSHFMDTTHFQSCIVQVIKNQFSSR